MNEQGRNVFLEQAAALQRTAQRLGSEFDRAVEMIIGTKGRVIISGMGKSGIIGRKIAATFASTGTSAFFVHPGEAYHGDLGMFQPGDVAILISYSGETEEVIRLVPWLQHSSIPIIAMVGKPSSTLGHNAQTVLDVSVEREVCPNNLAPTTSTTTTLVMGDALAVALIHRRGFRPQDFARFHPGGSLGRRLLTRVSDVAKSPPPYVTPDASLGEVITVISEGRKGAAVVLEGTSGRPLGIVTDGDLRRALQRNTDPSALRAADIMTLDPKSIAEDTKFADAEQYMVDNSINVLVTTDAEGNAVGLLHLLDAKRLN